MSGWDAVRRAIIAEANQKPDGNFFAKLGDIEPDHHTDDHHPRGLFQGIDFNLAQTLDADRKRRLRNNETWPAKGGWVPKARISTRRVRVWKDKDRTLIGQVMKTFGFLPPWRWSCRICFHQGARTTMQAAYAQADRHARTQH